MPNPQRAKCNASDIHGGIAFGLGPSVGVTVRSLRCLRQCVWVCFNFKRLVWTGRRHYYYYRPGQGKARTAAGAGHFSAPTLPPCHKGRGGSCPRCPRGSGAPVSDRLLNVSTHRCVGRTTSRSIILLHLLGKVSTIKQTKIANKQSQLSIIILQLHLLVERYNSMNCSQCKAETHTHSFHGLKHGGKPFPEVISK